jgi:hypothetical protein
VHRALIILVVLLAGCVPPPEIDTAIRADLRVAIQASVTAMKLPADQQPSEKSLDDSAGLLSIQSPPQRQQAILEGRIDRQAILGRGRDSIAQLAHDRAGLKPPAMLVWLVEHDIELDSKQLLLTDALTAQLRREAHLDK